MIEYLKYLFRKKKATGSLSLSGKAWRRFRKNKLAISALLFILLTVIISLLGYLIAPDSTPYANKQIIELTTQKPGSKFTFLYLRKNENCPEQSLFQTMWSGKKSCYIMIPLSDYHFNKDKILITEVADTTIKDKQIIPFSIADVCFPLANTEIIVKNDTVYFTTINHDKLSFHVEELRKRVIDEHIISRTFLLGTDRFGRDLLSRILIGTRVSLSVGFISVFISLIIGITLGSLSGFFRGRIDDLIMWLINVVWSIPTLLLVIAITFALGKGFWQVFIAVGLTMWVEVARVVRGQIISLREKEYVEAARAMGYSNYRIIRKHILPNVMAPVIVISAANFAAAILIEAGLSFLGIGVQPPMPSWGGMIKEHYGYLVLDAYFLALLPGIAIIFMVLAFMVMGNGLREALDVKEKNN